MLAVPPVTSPADGVATGAIQEKVAVGTLLELNAIAEVLPLQMTASAAVMVGISPTVKVEE